MSATPKSLTFAEEFKAAREAAQLTQAEAAEVLQVARRAIQQWEAGTRTPLYPAQFGSLIMLRSHATRSGKEK